MKNIFITASILLVSFNIFAEGIAYIGPYAGFINNLQKIENNQERDETGLIYGLYAQYINVKYFQVNDFFYYVPEVNKTKVIGNHLNGDFYPYHLPFGPIAVGAGFEYLTIDLKDDTFSMQQDVMVPYLRIGQYFKFGDKNKISLFPWLGAGKEYIDGSGDVTFTPPGSPAPVTSDFETDDDENIILLGGNIQYLYSHYLSIKFKYSLTRNLGTENNYYKITALVNSYIHRHFGISYRFMYDEKSQSEDMYNMLGVFYIF